MRHRVALALQSTLFALTGLVGGLGVTSAGTPMLVYLGTYTGEKSKGIYVSRFDAQTGSLTTPELAAEIKNPTFLALHPNNHFLFAVSEIENFAGTHSGGVSAYKFDKASGKLFLLNEQPSGGKGPCHLSVDATGKCLLVANYADGTIATLPIHADGILGPATTVIQHHGSSINPQRQSGPHAHFISTDPANRFAFCCDLGLDKVLIYQLDPSRASLVANEPPSVFVKAGAGPRHLAFHPSGRFAWVLNEMSSTLTTFSYARNRGSLTDVQTLSTLPDTFKGQNSGAEVLIHPSGKFVYSSNRGHDSIAIFRVDSRSGKLSSLGYEPTNGKTPRHFALAPDGRWLLAENQDSDTITVFRVNAESGKLAPTGQALQAPSPVCLVLIPTASF